MLAPRHAASSRLHVKAGATTFSAPAVGNRTLYALKLRRYHPSEPRWQSAGRWLPPPPPPWRAWLLAPGSLTELLRSSGGPFRVQLLQQRWQRPQPGEARVLQCPLHHWALIREVLLWVADRPRVYGRSVLPASSMEGPLRHLYSLGNRSLGSQLFRHPGLHRTPFQLARIEPDRHLPAAAQQHCPAGERLWGRRSRFDIGPHPLLVSEIFLPALGELPRPRSLAILPG